MNQLIRLDRQLYLDVNRFARHTGFAHSFMSPYAIYGGIVALAIVGFVAYLRARPISLERVAGVVWVGAGTAIAVGLNQPLIHLIGRARPYVSITSAEVLVPKANDFTFPSDHATAAGAMIVGLFLVDRAAAIWAVFFGLVLVFARVYVGAHYPGDVLAGLIWGGLIVAIGKPIGMRIINPVVRSMSRTPLSFLVQSKGKVSSSPSQAGA